MQTYIDKLYDSFAHLQRPIHLDGCSCCIKDSELIHLSKTPLKSISSDIIINYLSNAIYTVGTIEDYSYYLPRIIEIGILQNFDLVDPEVLGKKVGLSFSYLLQHGCIEPLKEIYSHIFTSVLENGYHYEVDSWVCAIVLSNIEINPFLCQIYKYPDMLIGIYELNSRPLKKENYVMLFGKTAVMQVKKLLNGLNQKNSMNSYQYRIQMPPRNDEHN